MVFVLLLININKLADMAELADALESGSSVLIDVGFDSLYPHHFKDHSFEWSFSYKKRHPDFRCLYILFYWFSFTKI